MTFNEIKNILQEYKFYGLTVKRHEGNMKLTYTFHSVPYFTVKILVDVLRLDKDRIVAKVRIANIDINDEKELIPTLNNLHKIHNRMLYGKGGNNHSKPKRV
jgi:hypothetical protein